VYKRFTTDFGLFGLKNYTKNMRCCQNKNNFIYFEIWIELNLKDEKYIFGYSAGLIMKRFMVQVSL
jgi:hypothetical protein